MTIQIITWELSGVRHFGKMNKRINTLESLRFFMVLTIALSHLDLFAFGQSPFFAKTFHNSDLGVHFFFILSGFGLACKHINTGKFAIEDRWSLVKGFKYAFSKVKGIYVPYLVSMAVCVPLVFYQSFVADGLMGAVVKSAVKLVIAPTLLQSLVGHIMFTNIFNGVCWFLSTLFILYIFYPLLEKLIDKICKDRKTVIVSIIATFICIILSKLLLGKLDVILGSGFYLNYVSPLYRVFFLILGIELAYLRKYSQKCGIVAQNGNLWEYICVAFILSVYLFTGYTSGGFRQVAYYLNVIVAAMSVYIFAFESGKISAILNNATLVKLGKNAFLIFLFHYPVLMYLSILF